MQQRTMKCEQIFSATPSQLSPSGFASVQPYYITANGFTLYNASGVLVGQKLP
jgi:hypothetical protein